VAATLVDIGASHPGAIGLRVGRASARIDARAVGVSIAVLVLLAVAFAWSISVGEFPIPIRDVVGELTGLGGSDDSAFIIRRLRLPRSLTAVLVGVAFGLSGQVFQRMVHNPLASPDILGVAAGAAAAAVFAIVVLGASSTVTTQYAIAGSIVTVVVIYLLAIKKGLSSYRLVLIGIGITAMLESVVAYLLTRAEIFEAHRATVWLTGSLNGRGWEYVRPLTTVLAVLVPVTLLGARQLRSLELGDDTARGIGVSVRRSKLVLSMSAAALAAAATAAAGPVAFVALVSPQIARRLVGGHSLGLVPAALVGALLMVVADLVARRAFAPTELPVGVVTAIVGAPYLLWLLARANRIESGG
jgi:iron complex transport system permease protein